MKTIVIIEEKQLVSKMIERTILSFQYEIDIYKTQNILEALDYAKKNQVDIFLMDILLLDDYYGITLAKDLVKLQSNFVKPVIFSTGIFSKESKVVEDCQNTHCYYFLPQITEENEIIEFIKPLLNYEMNNIESAITKIESPPMEIIINQRCNLYRIVQEEILYIEYKNKKLCIKTINQYFEFSSYTLKQIEEKLNDCFIRCHRSYIVNKNFIVKIEKRNRLIHLQNTIDAIPIGTVYLKIIKEYKI